MKRLIYGRPHLRTLKFKQLRTGKQAQRSFHAAFRTSSASSSRRKRSKNLSGTPPSASLLPRTTLRCLRALGNEGWIFEMLAKWGAFDASSMHPRFFARFCMFARVVCAPSLDFEYAKSCVFANDRLPSSLLRRIHLFRRDVSRRNDSFLFFLLFFS